MFNIPPAANGSLLPGLSLPWPEDDSSFPGLGGLAALGFPPESEFIGATTAPLHPVPAAPEAAFASDIPVHRTAENPTDRPQGFSPSGHGLGR